MFDPCFCERTSGQCRNEMLRSTREQEEQQRSSSMGLTQALEEKAAEAKAAETAKAKQQQLSKNEAASFQEHFLKAATEGARANGREIQIEYLVQNVSK